MMAACKRQRAKRASAACSMGSTPTAPRRSTASPSRRRSTTSLPTRTPDTISPSAFSRSISRAASSCWPTTSCIPPSRNRHSTSPSSRPRSSSPAISKVPVTAPRVRLIWLCFPPATRPCARPRLTQYQSSPSTRCAQYYAATVRPDLTTIVVIGDVTPEEARRSHRKMVWRLEGRRPQAQHHLAPGSAQQAFGDECA